MHNFRKFCIKHPLLMNEHLQRTLAHSSNESKEDQTFLKRTHNWDYYIALINNNACS